MVIKQSQKKNVRILLVGDRGVGKTSIILSLVSEEFPENVPARSEEITIPADVIPEQVPTNLVDYSAAEQTDEQLAEQIRRASVICVVYAVDDDESFARVSSYWLPLLREVNRDNPCPVVIVANKMDLVDFLAIEGVRDVMDMHSEVETCIECSAKTLTNISELFYYAQKAVLHPIIPLYDSEKMELTSTCQKALTRIFKICDVDNDGLLNDIELNNFQSRCFNAPLQPHILDYVKGVLEKCPEGGAVLNNSVTTLGFLYLHKLFIERGKNETTWTVLRKFGYNDNLNMSKEYLYPTFKVTGGCSTELSHKGQQFLSHMFERYDKDQDRTLSPVEFEDYFSTCPNPAWGVDVSAMVPTNDQGWITYQGYMCQWAHMTLTDLPRTFQYLAYLGYNIFENESQTTAVQVTREKKLDLAKKQSSRNVYQCHVIGPSSSGKSSFCRNFIRQSSSDKNPRLDTTGTPSCTVNFVQVYGQDKIMILRDINVRNASDPLLPHEVTCDVACLVYDVSNPKSFEYIARIYIKYFAESKIPVLVVACKSDLEEVKQEYLLQPASFCQKYKILPPQPFTSKGQIRKDVYIKLATMAAFPRFQAAWILFYKHSPLRRMVHMLLLRPAPTEWFSQFYRLSNLWNFGAMPIDTTTWWKAGIGLALATAFGFLVVKVLNTTDRVR